MRSKPVYRIAALIGIILFTALIANGQPTDPAGDPDVPITGIEILIALGGALGIRKFLTSKKNSR